MAKSNRRVRGSARGGAATRYTKKTLKRDREYGFFWYAWLWKALRPILVFICAFMIVFGVALTGFSYVQTNFFSATNPGDDSVVDFVIERNSSISTISAQLEEQELIRSKSMFKLILSLQGLSSKIQYGNYPLSKNMSVNEVIRVLTSGSTTLERTVTIIPGWTIKDIGEYFVRIGALNSADEFLTLCNDIEKFKNDYYSVEQAYASGSLEGRIYMLEGYLAPDTYQVFSNATAEELLRTLLKQTDNVIDQVFYQSSMSEIVYNEAGELVEEENEEERFKSTLTQEQTIVLASIIEREAGKKADYNKVSAVFHNRLLRDMPLESDATVSYALNINKMVLTSEELSYDSKYNTYNRKGLPVGPICNPSKAAIEAALYPDMAYINEEYLYFCSMDPTTSDLKFSKTLEEHQAAVAEYRPLWEAYDQSQGK